MSRLHTRITNALALVLAAVALSPATRAEDPSSLEQFVCSLTGHWDNIVQAKADIERKEPSSALHPRRAMTYIPIDAPAIEGQLFAIQNFTELGFDGPISRVSLHRFRQDAGTIVHEFMFLLDKAVWGDLAADVSSLTRLDESDVRINRDCAMVWRQQDGHFAGETISGRCVTSSFTPEPIRVEGHGEVWPDKLIRHDQNFSMTGEPLPVPGGDSPEVFDRVERPGRWPNCKTSSQ